MSLTNEQLYNISMLMTPETLGRLLGYCYGFRIGDTCPGDFTDFPSSKNDTDVPWDEILKTIQKGSIEFSNAFYEALDTIEK